MNEINSINLKPSEYKQKGLYLILPDSTILEMTKQNIETKAAEFWKDPDKINPELKNAVDLQRCSFCPLKGKDDLCDAMRPIFPFLDIVDKYMSFDKVFAFYKGDEKNLLHVAETTIYKALTYVSILSLMQYCQIGRQYWKYYFGIVPVEGGQEMVNRMYLNMYWIHKGNNSEIDAVITKFVDQIRITSQNQVKRLNLICKNDAFMDAFVETQIITEFLSMDIEKQIEESFRKFKESGRIM
ncbi:MAG: hypothetical protein ABIH09_03970 [Candidatus Omnitrophota bacterium]